MVTFPSWRLAFSDPRIEARYLADREPIARRQLVAYTVISIVGWAAFSGWDYVFLREHFGTMLLLRQGIGTAALVVAQVALLFSPQGRVGWVDRVTLLGGLGVLCSTLAIHALFPVETAPVLFAGLSIIVLVQHASVTARVGWVTPLTLGAVAAYFVIAFVRQVPVATIANNGTWLVTAELLAIFINHSLERLTRTTWAQQQTIAAEQARSDALLLNVLPPPVVARLKAGESPIADRVDGVTVVFGDIVGFTSLSQRKTPEELVSMLDAIFRELDAVAAAHGLEKIKTIGDAYMAAAGLDGVPGHAARAAEAALAMREVVRRFEGAGEPRLGMRLGLHTGPVVAGVIGKHKFSYDVWGDTVNTASRMESHGLPDEIQVSNELAAALAPGFDLTPRGEIEVKGKGRMTTWLLVGRAST